MFQLTTARREWHVPTAPGNPATDDPWDHVFFSPRTGLISARITPGAGGAIVENVKGAKTLELLGDIINGDPAVHARQRNWPDLTNRLSDYFEGFYDGVTSQAELFGDIDDYGLAEWLVGREGKLEPDVGAMINRDIEKWRVLRELPRS